MKIELWGVRGSLATPLTNNEYQDRLQSILQLAAENPLLAADPTTFIKNLPPELGTLYGGNTTCVTVTSADGTLSIIDAGTGLRALGDALLSGDAGKGKAHIDFFLTHTHWDHIQGLPFFKPIYINGNTFRFNSASTDLHERFQYQQKFNFFPREFDDTDSDKSFRTLSINQSYKIDESLEVDFIPLRHPGGSCAYRFKEGDKTFIFCTDVEFQGSAIDTFSNDFNDFFCGADILILDSQYTLDEAFTKIDWGHTAYSMAVNCGLNWDVKNLILTHHEPSYSDKKLNEIYRLAQEHMEMTAKAADISLPNLLMATEGMVFDL